MTYLCLAAPLVYAEDLTKYYNVVSPEYVERLSYRREQLTFQIMAPKGWYMVLANNDSVADRAIFFKSDPKKVLEQGHIQTPNIRVSFQDNPEGLAAREMVNDYAAQTKSAGGKILLEPQDIYAGTKSGGHFTSLEPKSSIIMDIYIFDSKGIFIAVMAICEYAEFDKLKPDIKESIDSMKF